MNEFILLVTLAFTTPHAALGSDLDIRASATYQKPFESKEACQTAASHEKFLMFINFASRLPTENLVLEHQCLETAGGEKL